MTATTDFTGRSVVLTGVGHRGQAGEVVARAFAERGATVFLVDRDPAAVAQRAAEIPDKGVAARGYACDLTSPDDVARLADSVAAASPDGIDVLVNMAGGFALSGPVAEADPDVWHDQFAINLTTAFIATRAFLPQLRKRGGALVFFAAAAALPGAGVAGMAAYAAAKSGVITLMRAVASEERDHGVRANALAPTAIRTETNVASMGSKAKYVEREAVAECVLWLASPASASISGQVIRLG